jgi:uncharacterized protein YpmS
MKNKKYLWPAVPIVLALLAIALVMHKPNDYAPLRITDQNQISTYVTHYLLPTIYNNSQLDEPFEVVITEEGLNDSLSRWRQPMNFDNITFTDPQVILTQNKIIFMATARTRFASPVLTIRITPAINAFGQLNIHVDSVSLGTLGITTLAKSKGKKAFTDWLSFTGTDPNDVPSQICKSMLNDEPFEPVFKLNDKSLRLCEIKLEAKKITALLLPLSDTPRPLSKNKTN